MSSWQNTTSRSKGSDRSEIRSVELSVGLGRLVVTRHIHYEPDQWTAVFDGVFSRVVVSNGTVEDAKQKAIILANKKLSEMMTLLSESV